MAFAHCVQLESGGIHGVQSTTKILDTPVWDRSWIPWRGIWGTIPNGISRIGNPLAPKQCCKWAMTTSSRQTTLNWGEGDELINSLTNFARCGKTFVGDCRSSTFPICTRACFRPSQRWNESTVDRKWSKKHSALCAKRFEGLWSKQLVYAVIYKSAVNW